MTKHNLTDTTFIIPVKIESDDRLRNAITVCCFLLSKFDTNILIKEVNSEPVFENEAIPQIKEFIGDISNISYYFEKESDNTFFHKTRYFNELLSKCDTDVVSAYDIDVLLPVSSYLESEKMCKGEYDLVYPFGFGTQENQVKWQKKVFASDELVSHFLNENFDFSIFESSCQKDRAQWGHAQFFKRESYIKGGMENENFKAWGPEDEEKHYRFPKLGYNIGRILDWVYHLEHSRGDDSERTNIYFHDNLKLMEDIRGLSVEELRNYYNTQEYLKKYHD
tara:strand:- start:10136 stop:10972 length:837 start_codon:yes stop_codon:yes gene_type:complete